MRGKKTPPILVEKAKAFYLIHENYTEVAEALNLPRKTVEGIIRQDDKFAEVRQQQKRLLIQEVHQLATKILREQVATKKARSLSEAVVAFGTLVDKTQSLAGENSKWTSQTSNIGNKQIIIEISKETESLLRRGKK